ALSDRDHVVASAYWPRQAAVSTPATIPIGPLKIEPYSGDGFHALCLNGPNGENFVDKIRHEQSQATRGNVLLDFSFDLGKLKPTGSGSESLSYIKMIEQASDQAFYARQRPEDSPKTLPLITFTTLTNQIDWSKDWSGSGQIRRRKNGLGFKLRLSQNLYRFWTARLLLTRSRVFESRFGGALAP
ncbi:MAG: hypothetical protein AB8G99_21960, partial [Planctomycetaceae bacterium]